MVFTPNDSPLAGREGTAIAGGRLGQRLAAEAEGSVSLRVIPLPGGGEAFEVQARGELQLGLLIGLCLLPSTPAAFAICFAFRYLFPSSWLCSLFGIQKFWKILDESASTAGTP